MQYVNGIETPSWFSPAKPSKLISVAHSALASVFCSNPWNVLCIFFLPEDFLSNNLFFFASFIRQISARNLTGVCNLGSEKVLTDYVYLEEEDTE